MRILIESVIKKNKKKNTLPALYTFIDILSTFLNSE